MITQYLLGWLAVILILIAVFILFRARSCRFESDEKDIIIETLSEQNDQQREFYEKLLNEKNDSIRLMRAQVQILNDEVARLHGRGKESFENE